jgi:hypothetical protein
LTDVPAFLTILETAFGDPDCITVTKGKLEALKETNCTFFIYYTKFQYDMILPISKGMTL